MHKKTSFRILLYATLGILTLFIGLLLIIYSTWIVNATIDAVLVLKPDGFVFKLWQKPPVQNKMSVYMFNWTNSHEIRNRSSKLKFEEIGPYIYYEQLEKRNFTFNDNDTITYKLDRTYYLDEENSKNHNDTIVTINTLGAVS